MTTWAAPPFTRAVWHLPLPLEDEQSYRWHGLFSSASSSQHVKTSKLSKIYSEAWIALDKPSLSLLNQTISVQAKQIIQYNHKTQPTMTTLELVHSAMLLSPQTHFLSQRLLFLPRLYNNNHTITKALLHQITAHGNTKWKNTPVQILREALLWLHKWHHTKVDLPEPTHNEDLQVWLEHASNPTTSTNYKTMIKRAAGFADRFNLQQEQLQAWHIKVTLCML
jgi:hypothetical protein